MRYSIKAARAIGRLKSKSNEIEVYVEDTANRNMWLCLIRTIYPSIRIRSVNQLGGRDNVIGACKLDQRDDGRKKLYIIDGDYDYLLGKRKKNLKFLYRLRSYCVENLFVSSNAVSEIGMIFRPNDRIEKIEKDFGYNEWISSVSRPLKALFCAYAIAHKLSPSTATTAYPVSKLYIHTTRGPVLCSRKVRSRISEVISAVKATCANQEYRKLKAEVLSRAKRMNICQIASGKDYLLPLFVLRLQKIFGLRGSNEQVKVQLSKFFVRESEPWLCRRLESIILET